jgi:hypothetical protein
MATSTSTNFPVAPFWYWPPVIAAAMGVGWVEALPYAAPNRALDMDAESLVVLVVVLMVCAFLIVCLRAESLEITSDEVIYRELWGVLRFQRSDISYVGSNAQMAIVRLIFVQLKSKKRPFIIPAYFRNGWMELLVESSFRNKEEPNAPS